MMREIIDRGNDFLIVSHKNPDGDALGASTALACFLSKRKKNVGIFFSTSFPRGFDYLPGIERVLPDSMMPEKPYDVVFAVDASDLEFCALRAEDFGSAKIVVIDHHLTNKKFGHLNFVEPTASSTCEYLVELFQKFEYEIDKDIATCLLTGVLTDTDFLSNQAVTHLTFKTVSRLLLHGANLRVILRNVLQSKSLASLKLIGIALSRLKVNPSLQLASTYITQADLIRLNAAEEDLSGLANIMNFIDGVKIALIWRENRAFEFKASLRTHDPLIDVAKIATIFGGGGHRKAAGFTIRGRVVETDTGWIVI